MEMQPRGSFADIASPGPHWKRYGAGKSAGSSTGSFSAGQWCTKRDSAVHCYSALGTLGKPVARHASSLSFSSDTQEVKPETTSRLQHTSLLPEEQSLLFSEYLSEDFKFNLTRQDWIDTVYDLPKALLRAFKTREEALEEAFKNTSGITITFTSAKGLAMDLQGECASVSEDDFPIHIRVAAQAGDAELGMEVSLQKAVADTSNGRSVQQYTGGSEEIRLKYIKLDARQRHQVRCIVWSFSRHRQEEEEEKKRRSTFLLEEEDKPEKKWNAMLLDEEEVDVAGPCIRRLQGPYAEEAAPKADVAGPCIRRLQGPYAEEAASQGLKPGDILEAISTTDIRGLSEAEVRIVWMQALHDNALYLSLRGQI